MPKGLGDGEKLRSSQAVNACQPLGLPRGLARAHQTDPAFVPLRVLRGQNSGTPDDATDTISPRRARRTRRNGKGRNVRIGETRQLLRLTRVGLSRVLAPEKVGGSSAGELEIDAKPPNSPLPLCKRLFRQRSCLPRSRMLPSRQLGPVTTPVIILTLLVTPLLLGSILNRTGETRNRRHCSARLCRHSSLATGRGSETQ